MAIQAASTVNEPLTGFLQDVAEAETGAAEPNGLFASLRMAPQYIRYGLCAFLLLSCGVIANLVLMQPSAWSGSPRAAKTAALKTASVNPKSAVAVMQPAPERRVGTPAAPTLLNEAQVRLTNGAIVAPGQAAVSADLVRAVQRELSARGYQPGAEDGVPGMQTRAAIMAFEADHGVGMSGEVSEQLLQWIVLGASGSDHGAPNGIIQPQTAVARDLVTKVQSRLAELGYFRGPVDGRLSDALAASIRQFEASRRWTPTGRVSGRLISVL